MLGLKHHEVVDARLAHSIANQVSQWRCMVIRILSAASWSTRDGRSHLCSPIDGDMDKIELEDTTIDIGLWPILSVNYFRCGRRVNSTNLPTRVRIVDGSGKAIARRNIDLPDLMRLQMDYVVSDRFRSIVESFEPGLHQFEPASVIYPGGERESRPFFILAVGQRVVTALDPERTRPPMRQFPDVPQLVRPDPSRPAFLFDSGSTDPWSPVFLQAAVAGRHLFCAGDFNGQIFVSEPLHQTLTEGGLRGLHFTGPFGTTEDAPGPEPS